MNPKKILALAIAALLSIGALAEPVGTEYLVDMTSEQVIQLEQRLSELGFFSGEGDSTYDAETRAALESFQQANGLEMTGTADSATLERLNSSEAVSRQDYLTRFANAYAQMAALELGAVSNDVLVMQRRLKECGYFSGERTACFGELTRQAVERFQQDSGLEVTGKADAATWAAIYSRSDLAASHTDAMQFGDSGDNVKAVQERLNALGFFDNAVTGEYQYSTETAVRLFQMAANLEPTGQLDPETSSRMMADTAPNMLESGVQQRFAAMLEKADAAAQVHIIEIARELIGACFGDEEDELYPGFNFVQYVCVSSGLPVTIPEDLIGMAEKQVQSLADVKAGNIVAFQSNGDGVINMVMAIGTGDSKFIGTSESGGWAELSYMERMDGATIYCWDAG